MSSSLSVAWQALVGHPLFGIGFTLVAYQIGQVLYRRSGSVFLQPVLIAMVLILLCLPVSGWSLQAYFSSTELFLTLLGTVVVSLAVPLYEALPSIRRLWQPLLVTVLMAGSLATLLGFGLAGMLGAHEEIQRTLLTKSVSASFAILIAPKVQGIAALAAIFTLFTGIFGAILGPVLMNWLRIEEPAARGLAMGITAHAVGAARALEESKEAGGFATLGMTLMGLATALLLPVLWNFW